MITRDALLADTFLKLADILVADPNGALQVMAASSEKVNVLELFQIQNDQGPCLDEYHTGRAIIHPDLSYASPWPHLPPER